MKIARPPFFWRRKRQTNKTTSHSRFASLFTCTVIGNWSAYVAHDSRNGPLNVDQLSASVAGKKHQHPIPNVKILIKNCSTFIGRHAIMLFAFCFRLFSHHQLKLYLVVFMKKEIKKQKRGIVLVMDFLLIFKSVESEWKTQKMSWIFFQPNFFSSIHQI